jgi:hypothetical protein
MGSINCLPELYSLVVNDNKSLGGEICAELLRKDSIELELFNSGKRIATPFLVGLSTASEAIPLLFQACASPLICKLINTTDRLQPKVELIDVGTDPHPTFAVGTDPHPTSAVDFAPEPEHRCARDDGVGSICSEHGKIQCWPHGGDPAAMTAEEASERSLCVECQLEPSKGKWFPWQHTWLVGLYRLVAQAKEADELEDFFVVCHADLHNTAPTEQDLKGVFEGKFLGIELDKEQQRSKYLHDDFDPKYALEGMEAHSLLDWERRAMEIVVERHPEQARMRYIDEFGAELLLGVSRNADTRDAYPPFSSSLGTGLKPAYDVEEATGRPAWYRAATKEDRELLASDMEQRLMELLEVSL